MSRVTKKSYYFDIPKKDQKLWVDSPCTLSFINKLPYIEQAKRFQFNSIYYNDDPHKPATKIDEFQKPDLLLEEYRRSIKQAEKPLVPLTSKNYSLKKNINKSEHQSISNPKEKQIVERLYPKVMKCVKLQYDIHGNRSSFVTQERDSKITKRSFNALKKYDAIFTESDRVDMSKPQNFNPGPGSYFNDSMIEFQSSKNPNVRGHKSQISTLQHRKKKQDFNYRRSDDFAFQNRGMFA